MSKIALKRVYEEFDQSDGYRILVDRLWPRGIKKENAHVDLWLKEIAPSTELRKWFNHEAEKWNEFSEKYSKELEENKIQTLELKNLIQNHDKITLLFGAKNVEHNQAMVLKKWIGE